MLSSAELKKFTFEKAVFGGYDAPAVDAALAQIAGDYEKLEQQNIELRSKMKVLIDKIEEYRRVEDGMRQALLTAQNIAEETMDKANREAEKILQEANEQAEQIQRTANQRGSLLTRQYEESLVAEKKKLQEAQHECAYFIQMMTRQFRQESERIAAIADRVGYKLPEREDGNTAETIEGSVEAPVEPQFSKIFEMSEPEEPAAEPQDATSFTVEVSGADSE